MGQSVKYPMGCHLTSNAYVHTKDGRRRDGMKRGWTLARPTWTALCDLNDANKWTTKARVDAVKFENYYQEDAYKKKKKNAAHGSSASIMWRVRVISCMNEYLGQG